MALLLSDRGQRLRVMAESIGPHEHPIGSWLKAYLGEGLEGLQNTSPPGRPPRKEHEALTTFTRAGQAADGVWLSRSRLEHQVVGR